MQLILCDTEECELYNFRWELYELVFKLYFSKGLNTPAHIVGKLCI